MNAKWVRENKLLSIVIVLVIIYFLIVLGTRQVPLAKEAETPAETADKVPAEKVEAPAEKAVAPDTAPVGMENESVKEQGSQP